jgi:carbon monoxide dehydrogenase subunit G
MEHVHSQHVAAEPDKVFAALADPAGMARFVPQLTRITPQNGDQVAVEARYEGRTQRGEAYFHTVEWGTAGGYRGSISVDADGDGSMLTLTLHTTHIEHADHDIAATLDAIRRLVEADV